MTVYTIIANICLNCLAGQTKYRCHCTHCTIYSNQTIDNIRFKFSRALINKAYYDN